MILRTAICAFLVVAATGCAEVGDMFGPSRPDPATQMSALESRVLVLVVGERSKIDPKARPLKLDPELTDIARKRSAEMAKTNSFGGNGDPHVSATMLMNQDEKFQGLIGENVAAQHFTPQQGIDVDVYAKSFVDGWIASKPHKDNLSFADYDHTGVGAAVNGDTIYVTQLFTTDLGLGASNSPPGQDVKPVASPQQGKDETQTVPLRGAIVPGKSAN
jgi:uncharacterized protein YkwD